MHYNNIFHFQPPAKLSSNARSDTLVPPPANHCPFLDGAASPSALPSAAAAATSALPSAVAATSAASSAARCVARRDVRGAAERGPVPTWTRHAGCMGKTRDCVAARRPPSAKSVGCARAPRVYPLIFGLFQVYFLFNF